MRKRMVAKKDMYLQVKKVIQKHSSSWTEISAFGTAFENFNEKLVELQSLSDGQGNSTIGVSALKDEKRDKTISSAMEILGAIKALASVNGSTDLKAQMQIPEGRLRHGGKQDLVHLLNRIHEKAIELSTELLAFGMDQAKIDAFTALRNELVIAISSPRAAVIDRKTITLKISERFEELDEILKGQLDTLMLVLKKQHPDFFKDYTGARIIIEPKGPAKVKSDEPSHKNPGLNTTEAYD